MPFCQLHIKASRAPHPNRWKCTQVIPTQPQTLGDHLKARRLVLHLMQQEVADQLGVHIESLKNWERGAGSPSLRQIPRIIEFLGNNPEPEPETLSARIANARRRLGLTQKGLAGALSIDPTTVHRWEKSLSVPPAEKLQQLWGMVSAPGPVTPR